MSDLVDVEKVETILGWPVAFVGVEPLIRDEELGRRLGYKDPRQVRKLVGRIFNDSELMHTVEINGEGGRPATVALLTERQALKVCMRSETPAADRIQDEVIEVFLAVRHNRLAAPAAPAIDPMLARLFDGQNQIAGMLAGKLHSVEERVEQLATNMASKAEVDAATKAAREAKEIASQARTLAGVRGMLDAIATSTPAGGSTATPDGAWSSKAPEGYRSMRAVARDYALPSDGVGCGFVGKVARALGVYEDLEAVAYQDVVIGGRARRQHVVYGPKAIQVLDAPLRAAHATMTTRGYTVKHGAMLSATLLGSNRSKDFVLQEMFETAVSGSQRDIDGRQTTIPGLVEERKAG